MLFLILIPIKMKFSLGIGSLAPKEWLNRRHLLEVAAVGDMVTKIRRTFQRKPILVGVISVRSHLLSI